MNAHALLLIATVTLACWPARAQDTRAEPIIKNDTKPQAHTGESGEPLDTARAVAKAFAFLGMEPDLERVQSAELVALPDDDTPYLFKQVRERKHWRVTINYGRLELESATPQARDEFERVFDVYLNHETGTLTKIASRWPEGVKRLQNPPPSGEDMTDILRRRGLTVFRKFPTERPTRSLVNILDIIHEKAPRSPLDAKQIVGYYIILSKLRYSPNPTWFVELRGVPPVKLHGVYGAKRIPSRENMYVIIADQTGEMILAGTSGY